MFQIMNSNEYVGDEGAREMEQVSAGTQAQNEGVGFAGLAAIAISSTLGAVAGGYAIRGVDAIVDWAQEEKKPETVNVNVAATPTA